MSVSVTLLFDGSSARIARDSDAAAGELSVSLDEIAGQLRSGQEALRTVSIDDILGICDAAAQAWVQPGSPAAEVIAEFAIGFLPLWLRRANLARVCDDALRGNRLAADAFVPVAPGGPRLHRAHPRGILVHWMAGNVPLLGMLSVVQGLLSKNANLVKVARQNAGVLPFLLEQLSQLRYTRPDGSVLSGRTLTEAVRVIYVDRENTAAAKAMSVLADVRIAWGGREAVEAIMNLPRRFGTEDLVFGPKTSFAIVGREMLGGEAGARRTARLAALDAAALDQRGCNSPHTVFVERGGKIETARFAALIAEELGRLCERLPSPILTAPEAFQVLGWRAEYDMRGDAWYSDGVRWSVFHAEEDRGLASPCYARTLFVRPLDDVFDCVPLCNIHTQTAGLAVAERRLALAEALTSHGIERCTELGRMSVYSNPWDGLYPIDRMVRWVSA